MQLRVVRENEKKKWNQFVMGNDAGSFCQSWEWSEFLSGEPENAFRFVVEDGDNWLAVVFLFKKKLKLGQILLYAPRGPIVSDEVNKKEVFDLIMRAIDAIAIREKALMFQFDMQTGDEKWCQVFDENGFVKSDMDIQPRHTLILDIRNEEKEILGQMHQKTRYNIRLAEKKGVEILVDNSAFKEYHELQKKTVERQGIVQHSVSHFKEMLKLPFVKLYLAKYEGRVIAANIMLFWNDTATYLFGASDYEYRAVMAPYLLQWQAIHNAKGDGCWFYDFWGAAPEGVSGRESRWYGFTKFKMGFSPEAELTEYLGTYEKQYQPIKLGLYRFLQNIYRK